MGKNYASTSLPGNLYSFAIIFIQVLTIAGLVVWPAVWSNDPSLRRAAHAVRDCIVMFFRPWTQRSFARESQRVRNRGEARDLCCWS
jgi:hypothetical protein